MIQPDQSTANKEIVTLFTSQGGGVFDVRESENAFFGTVTMQSQAWDNWSYESYFGDALITGNGSLSDKVGIKTNKKVVSPNYTITVIESLRPVSESEYQRRRTQLLNS